MPNFTEIDEARRLLRLGEDATLKEIKATYRRMANQYHPDKCRYEDREEFEETMKRINRAYKLLVEYCASYKYSFDEEAVRKTYPFDEYLRKFSKGWFDGP